MSILTTGFDEPTVDSIILNRATKSLTLYYQMIGRGSRILNNKSHFNIIDLGNNIHRFGPWGADLDWQQIFRSPNFFLERLLNDEELEETFGYQMPDELLEEFSRSKDISFDVKQTYLDALQNRESSKVVLEKSLQQHAKICVENSEDVYDALDLAKKLGDDIDFRLQRYTKCISKSTTNFMDWLKKDYRIKLRLLLRNNFDELFEEIHGRPAE